MTTTTLLVALLVLLAWTSVGLIVVRRLQPALARIALLVVAAALGWPITALGARFGRSRFSINHRPDADPADHFRSGPTGP